MSKNRKHNSYQMTYLNPNQTDDCAASENMDADSQASYPSTVVLANGKYRDLEENFSPTANTFSARGSDEKTFVSGLSDDSTDSSFQREHGEYLLHQAVRLFDEKALLSHIQGLANSGDINQLDSNGDTALHVAARLNNLDAAGTLIQHGASINHKSIDGSSPIHTALRHQSQGVVQLLVECGASVMITNKLGFTPLHIACGKKDLASATLILRETAADISQPDNFNLQPIHYSALSGESSICELLLTNGADVYARAGSGETPLVLAAGENNTEVMKLILKEVASKSKENNYEVLEYVNLRLNDGTTALHWAANNGNLEATTLLLSKGALINEPSNDALTPLHLAASCPNDAVVKQLLSSGANLAVKDVHGRTPLHLAAMVGTEESIKHLVAAGADINSKNSRGQSPIFNAVLKQRADIVKLFMQYGASMVLEDVEQKLCLHHAVIIGDIPVIRELLSSSSYLTIVARDALGRTAMHYAACLDKPKILQLLLDKSSMRGIYDYNGKTSLHVAAEKGSLRCLSILLEEAAQGIKDSQDNRGNTALHDATENGHDEACALLINAGIGVNVKNYDGQTALHIAAKNEKLFKELEELLCSNADKEAKDKLGDTPIITAVKENNVRAVHALLDNGASLATVNAMGQNALDAAIATVNEDVCLIILGHDRWKEALGTESYTQQMVLTKLIEALPKACHLVLDRCCKFSNHHSDHVDLKFTFDFSYMEAHPSVVKKQKVYELLPTKMVQHKREDLLLHPVTTEYLQYKWRSVGRYAYYGSFFLYLVYMVAMSYLIISERNRQVERFAFDMSGTGTVTPTNRTTVVSSVITTTAVAGTVAKTTARKVANAPGIPNNPATTPAAQGSTVAMSKSSSNKSSSSTSNNTKGSVNNSGPQNNRGTKPSLPSEGTLGKALGSLTLAFSTIMLLKEFLQMYLTGTKYFRDLSNYVEISLYSFSIVYMTEFLFKIGWKDENARYQLGILSLFFIYINLLLYLQRITIFKLYVVMFMHVVKTLLRVFFVFSFVILGFALTFHQMFPKQTTYNTVGRSIVKVLVMLTGEIDYENSMTDNINEVDSTTHYPLVPYAELSYLLFVIFLLILAVGLMNLLVGLAVGDIQAIRRDAKMQVEVQNAEYTQDVYNSLPNFFCGRFYQTILDKFPNRSSRMKRITDRFLEQDEAAEAQQVIKSIKKRTEEMTKRRKAMEIKLRRKERHEAAQSRILKDSQTLNMVARKLDCLT